MRAMIYARFSSDEQRPQSIDDRIVTGRRVCGANNWTVVKVYADAALTGATANRPGYQELLTDIDRGIFDVVVVEALDRLSRNLADVAGFYNRLAFRGAKLYATDHGEITGLMVGMLGTMAQAYLDDLKHKTKRGLRGKILAGLSAGALGYGYELDPAVKGARRVVEAQAEVVRRIFTMYADGASPRTIAATLNAEGEPDPGGRPWVDTTIRGQIDCGTGLLNNVAYVGRLEWNRCTYKRDPTTGKRVARPNPREQWETMDVSDLRIVDDALWRRMKAQQRKVHTEMGRDENGQALNRTHRAKPLLSGLIYCGACGAPFAMRDAKHYGCRNFRSKGTCTNRRLIARADLERTVAGPSMSIGSPATSFAISPNQSQRCWPTAPQARARTEGSSTPILHACARRLIALWRRSPTPATASRSSTNSPDWKRKPVVSPRRLRRSVRPSLRRRL